MFRPRIIPCLLLEDKGIVKTVKFKDPRYIGDPINAIRIFNEKEADELMFLDIMASRNQGFFSKLKTRQMPFDLLKKISRECLMPLSYGGGITTLDEMQKLFSIGIEKIVINTNSIENPQLIKKASETFGSQSIISSIDARKNLKGGYEVYTRGGLKAISRDPVNLALSMQEMGAGEIMITSIDCDGMMEGYDIDLIKSVSDAVDIPVIACGGAGKLSDLHKAHEIGHASGMAAGSMFVFHGRKRAVLISYPDQKELENLFSEA